MNNTHKIAVLDRALELLGRKGEHWVKGYYFARRDQDGSVKRAFAPKYATDWCLAGACSQAAVELGVLPVQDGVLADELMDELSLHNAVHAMGYTGVADFNDAENTSFLKLRRLVNGHIERLKGEPA